MGRSELDENGLEAMYFAIWGEPKIVSSNSPKKYRACPRCGSVLDKVKGTKRTWECRKCGYRVSPNVKKH